MISTRRTSRLRLPARALVARTRGALALPALPALLALPAPAPACGSEPSVGTNSGPVLIIARAVDARYPRHPTGGFYFDSATVVLHSGPIGGPIPPPAEVNFRIPLP